MKRIDFTNPATIKAAASFPFYGQAETLIRTIDPLWKVDLSEPREWKVVVEMSDCDCDCPHCDSVERKVLMVDAFDEEGAEEAAFRELRDPDWELVRVEPVALKEGPPFPDWIYDIAGGEQ